MRALALLFTTFALNQATSCLAGSDPESQPFLDTFSPRWGGPLQLFKRQGCPSGHTACTALNDAAACCPNNTVCARDQNGNVACCPTGAVCTGTIGGTASGSPGSSGTTATGTSRFVLGGTTTTPQTTSSPSVTSAATLAPGYGTVPNQYYPFILIPTTYANAQQCLSAYSSCQSVSTACFNALAGQNGVTVSGLGSQGVTQTGASANNPTSAASICSSLSSQGCYDISSTVCTNFGSTAGFVSPNGGAVQVARCTGAFYTAAAAALAGAGVAGVVLG